MTARIFDLRKFRVQRLLGDELMLLREHRSVSRLSFIFRECAEGKEVEEAGREYEDLQLRVSARFSVVEARLEKVERMTFRPAIG